MLGLRTLIYSKNPGDTINITHIDKHSGKTVTVPLTLSAKDRTGFNQVRYKAEIMKSY